VFVACSIILRDASGLFFPSGMEEAIIAINENESSSIIAYTLWYGESIVLEREGSF